MDIPYGASLASQLSAIPVRTDDDVLARVAAVIEPAARRDRTLWIFFLDSDCLQANAVIPIDDIPAYPGPQEADGLFGMLDHLVGPEGPMESVVLTITRAGMPKLSESDRRWAAILRQGAAENGTPVRMVCLATPEGVRELAPPAKSPGNHRGDAPYPIVP